MNTATILDNPEYFRCEPMRATIRKQVCIDRQEAVRRNGEGNCVYLSCQDCDQGKGIKGEADMAKSRVGVCGNCKREIYILQGEMCGSCVRRAKGLAGELRERALAKARVDFKGQGRMNSKRGEEVKARLAASYPKPEEVVEAQITDAKLFFADPPFATNMTLAFVDDTDKAVLEHIKTEARRLRRTPDQQAIWMLQSLMPESQGRGATDV
jgi:hypothetical protein